MLINKLSLKKNLPKKNVVDNIQRDIILQEYQSLAGYIQHFFLLRASILGLGSAMLGVLLSVSLKAQFPIVHSLGAMGVMLIFIIEKMLGATVRGTYVFAWRITNISEKYGVIPFYRYWKHYLIKRPHDGGQYAFLIAIRFLISAYFFWIIAQHYEAASQLVLSDFNLSNMFSFILIAVATPFLGWRLICVDEELNPKKFMNIIDKTWSETYNEIEPKVIKNSETKR